MNQLWAKQKGFAQIVVKQCLLMQHIALTVANRPDINDGTNYFLYDFPSSIF